METEAPPISMAAEPAVNRPGAPIVLAQAIDPEAVLEILRVIGPAVVLERTAPEAEPAIDPAAARERIVRAAANPAANLQIAPAVNRAVDQVGAATESAIARLRRAQEVAEETVPSAADVEAATAVAPPAPAAAVEEKAWAAAG
jgi:hypothetical protein